jgi:RNA polymerase sigma factor (sigma-70 family)
MASDAELLRAWADGQTEAGDQFIRIYFDLLWRYFRNKVDGETEDFVQDTLLACVRHRDRIGQVDDVRGYVLMIARNELLAHLRRKYGRDRPVLDPSEVSIHDLRPSPSTILARRHEEQRLLDALRQLPLELQELLELYYWEGLKSPELAGVLGVAEPTVRRRLQRARARLRGLLEAENAAPDDVALDALGRSVAPSRSGD